MEENQLEEGVSPVTPEEDVKPSAEVVSDDPAIVIVATSRHVPQPPPGQSQSPPNNDNELQNLREELEEANTVIALLRDELASSREENATLTQQLDQELQQKYDIGVIVEWENQKLQNKLAKERKLRLEAERKMRGVIREKRRLASGVTGIPQPGSSTSTADDEVEIVKEVKIGDPEHSGSGSSSGNRTAGGLGGGSGGEDGRPRMSRRKVPLARQRQSAQVINEGRGPEVQDSAPILKPERHVAQKPSATGPLQGQVGMESVVASGSQPGTSNAQGASVSAQNEEVAGPSSSSTGASTASPKATFNCDLCDMTFPGVALLRHHKDRIHGIDDPNLVIGCMDCGIVFSNRKAHMKHRMEVHGSRPGAKKADKQEEPQKTTYVRSNRKRFGKKKKNRGGRMVVFQSLDQYATPGHHLVGPDPQVREAKYSCSCGKSFAVRGDFQGHLRRKKLGKIFHCSLCDRGFVAHCSLKMHVKQVHKVAYSGAKFGCGICGLRNFSSEREVAQHRLRAHGGGGELDA